MRRYWSRHNTFDVKVQIKGMWPQIGEALDKSRRVNEIKANQFIGDGKKNRKKNQKNLVIICLKDFFHTRSNIKTLDKIKKHLLHGLSTLHPRGSFTLKVITVKPCLQLTFF